MASGLLEAVVSVSVVSDPNLDPVEMDDSCSSLLPVEMGKIGSLLPVESEAFNSELLEDESFEDESFEDESFEDESFEDHSKMNHSKMNHSNHQIFYP